MNFKMTVRSRDHEGKLRSATYKLEHVHSTGGDEEQRILLLAVEAQTNGEKIPNCTARLWIEELD